MEVRLIALQHTVESELAHCTRASLPCLAAYYCSLPGCIKSIAEAFNKATPAHPAVRSCSADPI